MSLETRDAVVDCVRHWASQADLPVKRLLGWLGLASSTWHAWQQRYGRVNAHNGWVPRDFWLEPWEKQAIMGFYETYPTEGYRRLTYMLMDRDIVAVSPTSVYRVLRSADRLHRWNRRPSTKGTGFTQPLAPHEHWHIDITHLNICGTFYYLCSVLDGYSRYIVHWEIRPSMTEREVEVILQRARERFPTARPRIISDNGPQFVARDFKEFVRGAGMHHVRTSPYYPQSNGKMERWYQTLKGECVRPGTPLSVEDAQRIVARFVTYYNTERLHSAIGYITPQDKLLGNAEAIFAERERKLEQARQQRAQKRLRATGDRTQENQVADYLAAMG